MICKIDKTYVSKGETNHQAADVCWSDGSNQEGRRVAEAEREWPGPGCYLGVLKDNWGDMYDTRMNTRIHVHRTCNKSYGLYVLQYITVLYIRTAYTVYILQRMT